MRERTRLDDEVQRAACRALLDGILEPLRLAARSQGYAVAVHGSLCRDLDLVAIPWIEEAKSPDELLLAIQGALRATVGNGITREFVKKPHGRVATIIITFCGQNHYEIDLSVMPRVVVEKKQAETDA